MDRELVAEAFEPVFSALRVDGSIVDVASIEKDRIVVTLRQSADCDACAMSVENLEAILAECLKDTALAGHKVTVHEN
jgi:Fe-S cluster biogenesis protein NfuA